MRMKDKKEYDTNGRREHCNEVSVVRVRFFFYKQKSAYDWRISDWSSDVCSSDLCIHQPRAARRGGESGQVLPARARPRRRSFEPEQHRRRNKDEDRFLDRKSGVSGKSVSVRVDIGGRRIIKKKTPNRFHIVELFSFEITF